MSAKNKSNKMSKMHLKHKKGVIGACMIVIALLLGGCESIHAVTDNFCLWSKPITVTEHELTTLSIETLREIDDFNQEWQVRCG